MMWLPECTNLPMKMWKATKVCIGVGSFLKASHSISHLFCIIIAVFHLPEQQVQILQPVERLRAGDTVHAVYPDTTSFYKVT